MNLSSANEGDDNWTISKFVDGHRYPLSNARTHANAHMCIYFTQERK